VLQRLQEQEDVRLVSVSGGSAHNAIPRDASALLAFPSARASAVRATVKSCEQVYQEENADTEPNLFVHCDTPEEVRPGQVLCTESAVQAIRLLNALPHGVHGMSTRVEGLVETSCNLAIVRLKKDALEIISSQRSSSMTRLDEMTSRVAAVAALAGATATRINHHPAWAPDMAAALLQRCRDVFGEMYDKAPVVEIIHAGLECGLIGDKVPGMEMISIGPDLRHPHSPDEKLNVPSVGRVYRFLSALLASYTR